MSDAITLILNGLLQGDLDAGGHKILNLDTSNLGEFTNQVPFADSQAIIKGSVDPTKLARFEVDGFTTATTRVFTLPNFNGTMATLAGTEPFTNKTYNGLTLSGSGGGIELNSGIISISDGTLVLDGDVTISGSGASLTFQLSGNTSLILPTIGTVAVTSQIPVISDVAYNEATWNGNLDGASKNSIRDKIETMTASVSAPFIDSTALVKGSANPLKLFRIEVDGLSVGTRVMTPPDYDFTPASISEAEALLKKTINGLLLAVGTAPTDTDPTSITEVPTQPFALRLIAISPQTGTTCVLRTTAPTDIILPVSGLVATVAGTIPMSYLSTDKDLNGQFASDQKVATQKAVRTYVDARTAGGKKDASDDSVPSTISVDLSGFDSTKDQITVTGTTDIEEFILDEGEEKVLAFDGVLNILPGSFLKTANSLPLITSAGSYVIVKGKSGAVVDVISSMSPAFKIHYGGDFYTAGNFVTTGNVLIGEVEFLSPFTIGSASTVSIQTPFQTAGAGSIGLVANGTTASTLPAGATTLEGRVAVPASAAAAGIAGQKAYDASFEYRCIASGNWVRNAHATW